MRKRERKCVRKLIEGLKRISFERKYVVEQQLQEQKQQQQQQ